jgi:hypothetical protein
VWLAGWLAWQLPSGCRRRACPQSHAAPSLTPALARPPPPRPPLQPQERAEEKLQALLALYANCPTAASQYVVLLVTVEFAKSSRALAQSLLPSLRGKADEWVKAWKLPDQQARDLYLALAAFMKVGPGAFGGAAGLGCAGLGGWGAPRLGSWCIGLACWRVCFFCRAAGPRVAECGSYARHGSCKGIGTSGW